MENMISSDAQSAMDAYLNLLGERGASESNVLRRRTFLTLVLKELEQLEKTDKIYGAVVDSKLQTFSQNTMRNFFKVTAREFYWFWVNDSKKIEAYQSGTEVLAINPLYIELDGSLAELIPIAEAYFLAHPHPALHAYEALRGAKSSLTHTRVQWMAVLLYAFRDLEQHPDMFRSAVNTVSAKFDSPAAKETFFVVVREFYPLWLQTQNLPADQLA